MSSVEDCPTCKALVVGLDHHRCPPAWEVSWPFAETSARTVHAHDAETAAQLYCERYDAEVHENGIATSGEARLSVQRDGLIMAVDVTAEPTIQYHAREVAR